MSLSEIIAKVLFLVTKKRKKIVLTNLKLVYPDMSIKKRNKLAKKIYENFVFYFFELIKYRNITKEDLKKLIEFEGLEKVKPYLNKPAIFITAHYGNWEIIPWVLGGILNIPMTIVVRKLDNKFLDKFFKKNREKFNVKVIEKRGALKVLMKDLRNGRSVGLLVDQNTAKSEGENVVMFGLKALHTPTAALLSKKFDVPIIPVFVQKNGEKYKIIFKDPIIENDVKKSVQKQSDVIEEMIKEKPEEWYWFHRRFKHYYEDRYEN